MTGKGREIHFRIAYNLACKVGTLCRHGTRRNNGRFLYRVKPGSPKARSASYSNTSPAKKPSTSCNWKSSTTRSSIEAAGFSFHAGPSWPAPAQAQQAHNPNPAHVLEGASNGDPRHVMPASPKRRGLQPPPCNVFSGYCYLSPLTSGLAMEYPKSRNTPQARAIRSRITSLIP
jgi:hypothetical protein